jgi:tripartite-type tricarboxylate transporter receptor subunit TctC
MAESGVRNVDVYSWQGVVGPKGLPADVRDKFHDAVVAALNDPQVKAQLTALGLEIVANTTAQFSAFQQQEFARWKKVIEVRKITAD